VGVLNRTLFFGLVLNAKILLFRNKKDISCLRKLEKRKEKREDERKRE